MPGTHCGTDRKKALAAFFPSERASADSRRDCCRSVAVGAWGLPEGPAEGPLKPGDSSPLRLLHAWLGAASSGQLPGAGPPPRDPASCPGLREQVGVDERRGVGWGVVPAKPRLLALARPDAEGSALSAGGRGHVQT